MNNISARSFVRQFSAPAGVNMAKYGANHYNDPGKSFVDFFTYVASAGRVLLSEKVDKDRSKQNRLSDVDYLICGELKNLRKSEKYLNDDLCIITINDSTINLEQKNHGVEVIVRHNNGKCTKDFIKNMTFEKMQDRLLGSTSIHRADLKTNPEKVIAQLLHPSRTLPAVPFAVQGGKTIPKIEEQKCPGGHDSVKIFAGTTFHDVNHKKQLEIADSTTVVFFNDMCATTVVGEGSVSAQPEDSRTYSALVTAAAIHTVQSLRDKTLVSEPEKFFFETLKRFESKTPFIEDKRNLTFSGVVLFYNDKGMQQQFNYGLGDTALALTDNQGKTKTLHLQSGVDLDDNLVKAEYVTATFDIVNPTTSTIQLMTDGCKLAFYDLTSKIEDAEDIPATLQCNNALPKHGEFNPDLLTNLANPTLFSANQTKKEEAEKRYKKLLEQTIHPLNEIINGNNPKSYRILATEKGQKANAEKFTKAGIPMPDINNIKGTMQLDKIISEECASASGRIKFLKGDDVLHLSIDVPGAFKEITRRSTNKSKFN